MTHYRSLARFGMILVLSAIAVTWIRADEKSPQSRPNKDEAAPQRPRPQAQVPQEVPLAIARREVRMLDDIYKLAIVLITDKYVHDVTDFPAGSAAVQWFKAIGEKGWHQVRLIDATGEPEVPANAPRDEFEKMAVRQLKAGKTYVEKIETVDGRRVYRAATPVPVVMEKCIMCHEHYREVPPGKPVGALVYTIPLRSNPQGTANK